MGPKQETNVKVYKDTDDYQKDAPKMMKNGWQIASSVERRPRAGIGRIATLGLFTLVRPPKPELVVTYTRWTGMAKTGNPDFANASQAIFCPKCSAEVPPASQFCPSCGLKRFNPPG